MTVWKQVRGDDTRIGQGEVNADGKYSVAKRRRPGRYYATVPARVATDVAAWVSGRSTEERTTILAPFGWWYGSGTLESDWSDEQLVSLLNEGIAVDPGFRIGERLKARSGEDVGAAVAVTEALVSALSGGWALRGLRDELRTVLAQGLQADDEEVVDASTRVIHALGAQGLLDFRDLLRE